MEKKARSLNHALGIPHGKFKHGVFGGLCSPRDHTLIATILQGRSSVNVNHHHTHHLKVFHTACVSGA